MTLLDLKHMPRVLGQPFYPEGYPLNFQTDNWWGTIKQDLLCAVKRYYNVFAGEDPQPTKQDERLLIEFMIYFINAPIWKTRPLGKEPVMILIRKADRLKSVRDVQEFIEECTSIGLPDPI